TPSRPEQDALNLGNGRRDRYDDDALQHVHHLLRHERVDREATLRQRRKEKCGEQYAERIVASDESNGDSEKSRAASESIFVVVLVTEDEVDAAQAGYDARYGHRAEQNATDGDSSVFGCVRLQADRTKLVSSTRAEHVVPHRDCGE